MICIQIHAAWRSEMWHIGTTVIRLLDGTRAYLHAVIDNFSRKDLAWRVAETFAPQNSVAVLLAPAGVAFHRRQMASLASRSCRSSQPIRTTSHIRRADVSMTSAILYHRRKSATRATLIERWDTSPSGKARTGRAEPRLGSSGVSSVHPPTAATSDFAST